MRGLEAARLLRENIFGANEFDQNITCTMHAEVQTVAIVNTRSLFSELLITCELYLIAIFSVKNNIA